MSDTKIKIGIVDYSKIDFSKFQPVQWKAWLVRAQLVDGKYLHLRDGSDRSREVIGCVAYRDIFGWSVSGQAPSATFTELDQLKAICAQVDAFIASELKRIAEEALPPWRECTLEEAFANPGCSEWTTEDPAYWKPMRSRIGDAAPQLYSYRTRAPQLRHTVTGKDALVALMGGKGVTHAGRTWKVILPGYVAPIIPDNELIYPLAVVLAWDDCEVVS